MKRRHDAYFHPQLCALSAPSRVPRGNTIGGTAIPFFISICIYTMKKNVLLSDLTFLVGEWKAELSDISFLPDRSPKWTNGI